MAAKEYVQLPTACEPAAQPFGTQLLLSQALHAPAVQPVVPQATVLVRTVLPVYPAAHVPFSDAAGRVAAGHSSVQDTPDSTDVPLLQVAVAAPE
jgi:hypothetical protein